MITIILMLIQSYCQMFGYKGFIADWHYALGAFMLEWIIEFFMGFCITTMERKK